MSSSPILPGATIGILGGGQLGRMFALCARKMGYRVHTFDPTPDSPTGQVADREVNRPYEDHEALREFARGVEVITYEFENIPVSALEAIEELTVLRPNKELLHITQNRRREKEFLASSGFPVTEFRVVSSCPELEEAVREVGCPCVLKTADFGYDGKGQQKIEAGTDIPQAWKRLAAPLGVVEAWVTYQQELSCLVARGATGDCQTFPVVENRHTHHILDLSLAPAEISQSINTLAKETAKALADKLELVGLLAVEFFLTTSGKLLINELAPRPHNSGHFSFDACVTSQFEQQLRAVCGLPLGETRQLSPAIMRNLLGDLWTAGEPDWNRLLAIPGLKLHLYGKSEPRMGRKMGHYTILAPELEECLRRDSSAQKIIQR